LFQITWGNSSGARFPPSVSSSDVFVKILGTTKELLALEIRRPTLSKRPLLEVSNARDLLGPTPPPRHFVEELLGGKSAYETISAPDKVQAWLLTSLSYARDPREKKDRTGPVELSPALAIVFADVFLNFDSYRWSRARGVAKACVVDYGARLRFTRGSDVVDICLCYECDILEVRYKGQSQSEDFDDAHNRLVKSLQAVFPNDRIVQGLPLHGRN